MSISLFRTIALFLGVAFGACAFAQTTVTLRDVSGGYSGTRDNYGAVAFPDSNQGSHRLWSLNWSTSAGFIRFAIFASEGGPVPDDATITSATLSIYQADGASSTWDARRLLKGWEEMSSTWNQSAAGAPWQSAGAQGAGDVADTADGQSTITTIPGWLNLDVTAGVQAFANATANHGWRIGWLSGTTGAKSFHTRNANEVDAALRPALRVTYVPPTQNCASAPLRPYEGAPVNGSPISINATGATTFEAEHFNCGGQQSAALNDTTPAVNAGQTFRANESVDIIGAPGGLAVNEFIAGEWLVYTINVQTGGTYDLGIRASANPGAGSNRAFRIEIDGQDVTGAVPIPDTNGWDDYRWIMAPGVHLDAGQRQLRLVSVTQYFRVDKIQLARGITTACNSPDLRPYDGAPVNGQPIPISASGTTTLEAEHFDCGGPNVAYNEITGNNAGQTFRAGEDVDIIAAPTGLAVNEFDGGEWLVYSIQVPTTRAYDIRIFAASGEAGPFAARLEVDGNPVGDISITNPEGWNTYKPYAKQGVQLGSGLRRLKLVSVTPHFRVDKIQIVVPTVTLGCGPGTDLCALFDVGTIDFGSPGTNNLTTENDLVWEGGNKAGPNNTSRLTQPNDRISIVDVGADRGGVLKFTTQDDDRCVPSWVCTPETYASKYERSEINLDSFGGTTGATEVSSTEPRVQWWAHSVYFPPEFQIRTGAGMNSIFLQFHNGGNQPGIALEVFNQYGTNNWKVLLARAQGPNHIPYPYSFTGQNPYEWAGTQHHYQAPGAQIKQGQCIHDKVKEGVWYDFVHYFEWSSNRLGKHKIWMRENYGPVKKVLDKSELSTIWTLGSSVNRNWAYLKIGSYHVPVVVGEHTGERLSQDSNGAYRAPLTPGVSSVMHDRIVRGDSFAAVAPAGFTMPANDQVIMCLGATVPSGP